jgi:hypothetical protein
MIPTLFPFSALVFVIAEKELFVIVSPIPAIAEVATNFLRDKVFFIFLIN